jgi:hypothetical protein
MTQGAFGCPVYISIQEGEVAIFLSLYGEFYVGVNAVHVVQEAIESSEFFMKNFAAIDRLLLLSRPTSDFFVTS